MGKLAKNTCTAAVTDHSPLVFSPASKAMAQQTQQKIEAFRGFAAQLAGQVVEQLCQEFEREVSVMWNELVQYRNELGRVAELLGSQLHRERQLHDMLGTMAEQHSNLATSAQLAAQKSPNSKQLHEMVDAIFGQQNSAVRNTLDGVSQAYSISQSHAQAAAQLQEPLLSAEGEFNRLMQILATPMIPGQAAVTTATVSQTPPMTPSQMTPRRAPALSTRGNVPVAAPLTNVAAQSGTAYVVQEPIAGRNQTGPVVATPVVTTVGVPTNAYGQVYVQTPPPVYSSRTPGI